MSDDVIHRFSFADAPVRGQWVRLTETIAEAARRQQCPPAGQRLLSEMLAAVSLMADAIKFQGTVALQARGQGPVGTALAECRSRHLLRGLVRVREGAELPAVTDGEGAPLPDLLGDGQMAITLQPDRDRAPDANAYQGVVALDGATLAENLEGYFANSEQLPTRLFLAATPTGITGLLLQRLPDSEGTLLAADADEEAWREIELLAATVRPQELATLPVEALLRRLFHQRTITVHPGRTLSFECTCSRERAGRMLQALPKEEILELLDSRGSIDVTCEVCGARYDFDRFDTHLVYEPAAPRLH
ncbi:MAG: Hsp33 family molecular chaperone HslO [Pseudomonadales bacterium]